MQGSIGAAEAEITVVGIPARPIVRAKHIPSIFDI
jgi:hypothetical protein